MGWLELYVLRVHVGVYGSGSDGGLGSVGRRERQMCIRGSMELDALVGRNAATRPWARTALPRAKGGGKIGGKAATAAAGSRTNETQGWWMRPCAHCHGRHMTRCVRAIDLPEGKCRALQEGLGRSHLDRKVLARTHRRAAAEVPEATLVRTSQRLATALVVANGVIAPRHAML